jgi:hypothetical protein
VTLTCGRTFTPTLLEGRDSYEETEHALKVLFRDEAGQVVEQVRIQQSSIAMLAIRTRTVEADPVVPSHPEDSDALV